MSELALQLIREAKEKRLTSLDLGYCGLTELPDELFKLTWLEELVVSDGYEEFDFEKNKWATIQSKNNGAWNELSVLPPALAQLAHLKKFACGGWGERWQISDLRFLEKLTSLQSLDLSFNQISDIRFLENLTSLQSLNLSGNQISDIRFLENLTSIQSLDLSGNQISDIRFLEKLTSIQSLNLSRNQISDIRFLEKLTSIQSLNLSRNQIIDHSFLKKLTSLQSLNLSRNQISDYSFLENLTSLQSLYLSGNQISDLCFLEKLTSLQSLYLTHNQISDLCFLENLTSLQSLNLSGNQISDYSFLENLTSLQSLNLSGNQISDLRFLEKLTSLQSLYLRGNQISDLRFFEKLTSIQSLNLSNNQISDLSPLLFLIKKGIPVEWEEWGSNVISVKDNPLENPPPEIVQQGNQAILDYFAEREAQGTGYLYEAKLLIIGEPSAGKTSLFRKLQDPASPLPEEGETTKGIDIHVLEFPMKNGRQFRMNVWDFGGQEIDHATHQFFLNKRSLYVLLDDTRKDDRTVTDPAFRYWLQVVELLGGGSPLLIVQNEKADRSKNLDLPGMKARFGFIKDSYRTNLLDGRGLAAVREAIEFHIQNLPHVGSALPKQWVVIREEVEKLTARREYLSDREWFELCDKHQVTERRIAKQLSEYFHDIGVFLHFQDDDLLRRTVILQKTWATAAVYRVLDDEPVKQRGGQFTRSDLARIWHEERLADMQGELLALMMKFELCYPIPDVAEEKWLAPQLLPAAQPAYEWAGEGNLDLRYRYDFLPKGLLSRIIVRLHRFVNRTDLAWRSGAVLVRLGARAEVIELSGGIIRIRVQGEDRAQRKQLLTLTAEEFDRLHGTFHNLRVEKLIPCICEKCRGLAEPHFYEHSDLLTRKKRGKRTIECRNSYEDVEVVKLLDEVTSERPGEDLGEDLTNFKNLSNLNPSPAQKKQTEIIMDKKTLIQDLIANNRISDAIAELKAALPGNAAVIASETQFKQLRDDEIMGVLSFSETTQRRNQITSALLKLTEQIGQPAPPPPRPEPTGARVFLSYNHDDAAMAEKVRNYLASQKISVTIDSENLGAGQDIDEFILDSIRQTDFTISLVSTKSLLSGWVGRETMLTMFAEKLGEKKFKFIACALDDNFFSDDFAIIAGSSLMEAIQKLDENIGKAKEMHMKTTHYDKKMSRLQDLKHNLSDILDRLLSARTENISGDKFDAGMARVVKSISNSN